MGFLQLRASRDAPVGEDTGVVSVTLGAVTLAATGTVDVAAALAVTLGAATLSATGTVDVGGATAATLGAVTLAGTGTVAVAGAAAVTLGTLTSTATGTVDVQGTLTQTLGALTLAATGTTGGGVAADSPFPSDITTVLNQYLVTNGLYGDVNTSLREYLRTVQSYGEGMDLTTLVTQQDFNSTAAGGTLREMPAGLRLVVSHDLPVAAPEPAPVKPGLFARARGWFRRKAA